MVLEDLNSDGRTDIVIRVLEPNQLVILLQHQHSWQERSLSGVPFGDTGEGFAIGDIDGKGNPDIAIGGYWLETPADIVEGEFISHSVDVAYSTVNSNTKQAIGDINGDGRNDIVISPAEGYRQGANYDLAWYEAPRVLTTSGSWKKHVVASDFNGGHTIKLADIDLDGDLDLVSGVCWNLWGQRKHISLYLFDSNLQEFATPQFISVENGLYTGVLADLDDDGDLDIIGQDEYAGHGRPYFYENRLIR